MSVNTVSLSEAEQGLLEELISSNPIKRKKGWQFVYKTVYPTVQEFVRKNSGSEQDATDIFQDGVLILLRNLTLGTFREEASIKTYAFRICRNLWLKELTRRQKQLVSFSEIVQQSQEEKNYLIETEIVSLVLLELKDDCRNILLEYYFNNKSMVELMAMFDVNSIQAVKNKKKRCLNYLEKLIKEKAVNL